MTLLQNSSPHTVLLLLKVSGLLFTIVLYMYYIKQCIESLAVSMYGLQEPSNRPEAVRTNNIIVV